MNVAIDFDGTIVEQDHAYSDLKAPLTFVPGAKEALHSLKRAGHVLILWSGRANRALRVDPNLDPLVRAGIKRMHRAAWEAAQPLQEARYRQMIDFVGRELPGVFDAIDDGEQGKPAADLFLDDQALRIGSGSTSLAWTQIARMCGEPEEPHG